MCRELTRQESIDCIYEIINVINPTGTYAINIIVDILYKANGNQYGNKCVVIEDGKCIRVINKCFQSLTTWTVLSTIEMWNITGGEQLT